MGVLWLTTAVLVLAHRWPRRWSPYARLASTRPRERSFGAWTFLLLAATTATSLAGLPLVSAIAVPRVLWKTVDAPDLVLAGGETWRKLRGPAVLIPGPPPDVAVPTVGPADRWVLLGLLSGSPVEGLPAALPAPNDPAAPRLCRTDADGCRPWPGAWPDPSRPPPFAELLWTQAGPSGHPIEVEKALGYDVETGLYLRVIDPPSAPGSVAEEGEPQGNLQRAAPRTTDVDGPFLELVGRVTSDAPRDGTSVLFTVRRVSGGRLRSVRVVATPLAPAAAGPGSGGHAFHVQRAEVSLTAGPQALRWFARPLLSGPSFALPLPGCSRSWCCRGVLRRGRRGRDMRVRWCGWGAGWRWPRC